MGWSFLVADTSDLGRAPTSVLSNQTTLTRLSRYELQLAFLPYASFPRVGSWERVKATAAIWHLTGDGGVGKEFEQPDGVVPFRGHRQRLDRYDELDFDALEKVMRELGLWSPHIQRTAD